VLAAWVAEVEVSVAWVAEGENSVALAVVAGLAAPLVNRGEQMEYAPAQALNACGN
jgi:hypothetical protein